MRAATGALGTACEAAGVEMAAEATGACDVVVTGVACDEVTGVDGVGGGRGDSAGCRLLDPDAAAEAYFSSLVDRTGGGAGFIPEGIVFDVGTFVLMLL